MMQMYLAEIAKGIYSIKTEKPYTLEDVDEILHRQFDM